jgi:hypothetical protein
MKVNKVYNAQQIMEEKGILIPQLYCETHVEASLKIQRTFRSMLINRHRLGRQIANKHKVRTDMWKSVLHKYRGL